MRRLEVADIILIITGRIIIPVSIGCYYQRVLYGFQGLLSQWHYSVSNPEKAGTRCG
jgi:hypothetical protein